MEDAQQDQDLENQQWVTNMLDHMLKAKSRSFLKKFINWFNDNVNQKESFFQINDFFNFFCFVAEEAINDNYFDTLLPSLDQFFIAVVDVCYQWKCLSDQFEGNYSFFNSIQTVIKQIIDKFNETIVTEKNAINTTIPLMLSSMVVILSTIHSLKEVVLISKPIVNELIAKMNINSLTTEWKVLISQLTNVINIWNRINDIDITDAEGLSQFVIRLVDLALGRDPFMAHISGQAIRCVGEEKNILLNLLFIEYQYQISGFILEKLKKNENFNEMEDLLHKTMHLFGINTLPKEFLRHIIPYFVVKCDQKTERFLKEMSQIDCGEPSKLFKFYFCDIIRHLFYDEKPKTLDKALTLTEKMSKISNFDVDYRIKICDFEIVNSLLMLLSKDYDATLQAIAFVQHLKTTKDSKERSKYCLNYFKANDNELRAVLKEYFLPFIHKYEGIMQDNSICISDKMTATKSFVQLIDFVESESINLFRVKLFSTIKLIISEKFHLNRDLLKLSIEAMNVFVSKADQNYICTQLAYICALLLPLMHFWPNDVSSIFNLLIVERKTTFESEFKHLYFIPDLPELKRVTETINSFINNGDSDENTCDRIKLVVQNVNHENRLIKIFALEYLSTLLVKHQKLIYNKCDNIKELDFDYFVTDIVNKLMVCLKSSHQDVIGLAAKCLGILGAIDPSKIDLEKPVISKEDKSDKFLNFNDDQFKLILITLLYKTITTAESTDIQYCASFALQEVVKYLKNEKRCGRSDFTIDDLPLELKGMCEIFEKTRYNRSTQNTYLDPSVKFEPFFGSIVLSYKDWLQKWLSFLFESFIFKYEEKEKSEYERAISSFSLSQHSGPTSSQISDAFELELANALDNHSIKGKVPVDCYLSLLRSQSIAHFLLPYIVITALKNASLDQRYKIVLEIKTVITTLLVSNEVLYSEIGHLSSQTVFQIYDYLKIWHKNRIQLHRKHCSTARQLRTAKIKDREFRGVEYFLNEETGVSVKDLSRLAFKCNANCRSLRYLEGYVKNHTDLFQNEIPLFQQIFARLEEPDSVEGCDFLRTESPSIKEQILTHEAMGQIQEALICCAKAVDKEPNDLELQEKYLQISMDSFDQSEMVCTYGMGLIARKPEWQRYLTHHIIEAIWRLGDWHQLDLLLERNKNKYFETLGSGLGEMFSLMNKKIDTIHDFEEKVNHWRTAVVGPLSAAAMEISGYVRGHKYIVDLHILHDIQLLYDKLINEELNNEVCSIENVANRFSEVIEIFDRRNDLVRPTTKFQEPILNSQRAMFNILVRRCPELLHPIRKQLFKSWLMSTKTARKVGNIQRSYNCLLEMNKIRDSLLSSPSEDVSLTDIDNCEAIVEAAKIKWDRNQKSGLNFTFQSIQLKIIIVCRSDSLS